jgi:hypothetical protein
VELTVIKALAAPMITDKAYIKYCNVLGKIKIPAPENTQSTAPIVKKFLIRQLDHLISCKQ